MLPDLEVGAIFAREYRVERPLRSGGMGTVLVVEHIGTGKLRALKLLAGELEDNEEMRERFVREARAASAIESEHVVEIITAGVDEETNRPYIIMELLQGEDLGDRIERLGPLDHTTAALVFRQLGHALGAAHRRGIVHRDLKPENVFLAQGRRPGDELCVKLLDFGVAKILPHGALSQPTQPLGSPLFMSPEQTDADGAIMPSTDVWALGLLAFFLLTGQYFWISAESCSVPALLREVCFDELPPASVRATVFGAKRDSLPDGFDAWFAGCVSREAGGRFPDGETAANALADILEQDAHAPEPARPTPIVPVLPTTLDADWFFDETPHAGTPPSLREAVVEPPESAPISQPDPLDEPAPPPKEASVAPPQRASRPSAQPVVVAPAPHADTPGEAKPAEASESGRTKRERMLALRNVLGAVAAGCLGGGVCFIVVGGLPFAAPGATAEADSATPVESAHAPHPPRSAAPAASGRAAPPAAANAAGRPSAAPPRAAPPVARAWTARPEDAECPTGMRRVVAGDTRFCVHATEVTVAQWIECANAHACPNLDRSVPLAGIRPDADAAARLACVQEDSDGALPVNCIDRASAMAFCKFARARLPSEDEWLAAARGSGRGPRAHPWGEEPLDVRRANTCDESCVEWAHEAGFLRVSTVKGDDGAATLAPVGIYAAGASPDLVLDLAGNVAEWTSSDTRDGAVARGSSFASSTQRDDEARVIDPKKASPEIGFRCAADL